MGAAPGHYRSVARTSPQPMGASGRKTESVNRHENVATASGWPTRPGALSGSVRAVGEGAPPCAAPRLVQNTSCAADLKIARIQPRTDGPPSQRLRRPLTPQGHGLPDE